ARQCLSRLKLLETSIVPTVRLKNTKGPLIRWMRPVIVCLDPSGLIGKYMATKTPTPHIPKRIRPIRDRADCGIPLYNPITKDREATLMLRKAVVIRNPYGPTA